MEEMSESLKILVKSLIRFDSTNPAFFRTNSKNELLDPLEALVYIGGNIVESANKARENGTSIDEKCICEITNSINKLVSTYLETDSTLVQMYEMFKIRDTISQMLS